MHKADFFFFFSLCCPVCTIKKFFETEMNVQYFWLAKRLNKRRPPQEEEVIPSSVVWRLASVRDVYDRHPGPSFLHPASWLFSAGHFFCPSILFHHLQDWI